MTVVETERQTHEVRVEALAHVHLDGERLFPRDEPPSRHERRPQHAEADDRPDVHPELARVVRSDRVVDHVLRHPDERDLRSLRRNGEHDRDDERDLVRPEEAEQAGKDPIRRSTLLLHP